MKILVTGASGFIGKHRVNHLVNQGNDVITTGRSYTYDRDTRYDTSFYYRLDIADRDAIKEIISRHKPDRIEHYASLAIVSTSRHDPYAAYRTNVLGAVNVLEAAKLCHVPEVMMFTTDKYYGDAPIADEHTHPIISAGAYETSKLCQDVIAQSYIKQGINVKIIRSCNVFGPFDTNSRIVPNTLKALYNKNEPLIFINILGKRQYIYINDLMSAIDIILSEGEDHIYNVGTSICDTQENVVMSIIKVWNKTHGTTFKGHRIKGENINEIPEQYLKWKKLYNLGWRPQWTFEHAIRNIIDVEVL